MSNDPSFINDQNGRLLNGGHNGRINGNDHNGHHTIPSSPRQQPQPVMATPVPNNGGMAFSPEQMAALQQFQQAFSGMGGMNAMSMMMGGMNGMPGGMAAGMPGMGGMSAMTGIPGMSSMMGMPFNMNMNNMTNMNNIPLHLLNQQLYGNANGASVQPQQSYQPQPQQTVTPATVVATQVTQATPVPPPPPPPSQSPKQMVSPLASIAPTHRTPPAIDRRRYSQEELAEQQQKQQRAAAAAARKGATPSRTNGGNTPTGRSSSQSQSSSNGVTIIGDPSSGSSLKIRIPRKPGTGKAAQAAAAAAAKKAPQADEAEWKQRKTERAKAPSSRSRRGSSPAPSPSPPVAASPVRSSRLAGKQRKKYKDGGDDDADDDGADDGDDGGADDSDEFTPEKKKSRSRGGASGRGGRGAAAAAKAKSGGRKRKAASNASDGDDYHEASDSDPDDDPYGTKKKRRAREAAKQQTAESSKSLSSRHPQARLSARQKKNATYKEVNSDDDVEEAAPRRSPPPPPPPPTSGANTSNVVTAVDGKRVRRLKLIGGDGPAPSPSPSPSPSDVDAVDGPADKAAESGAESGSESEQREDGGDGEEKEEEAEEEEEEEDEAEEEDEDDDEDLGAFDSSKSSAKKKKRKKHKKPKPVKIAKIPLTKRVELLLGCRLAQDEQNGQYDWFVKWRYRGYQHCSWIPQSMALMQDQGQSRISRFLKKHQYTASRLVRGNAPLYPTSTDAPTLTTPLPTQILYHPPHPSGQTHGSDGTPLPPLPATGLLIAGADEEGVLYNPDYCEVDRIIAHRRRKGTPDEILAEKNWRAKRREERTRRRKIAAAAALESKAAASSSSSSSKATSAPAAAAVVAESSSSSNSNGDSVTIKAEDGVIAMTLGDDSTAPAVTSSVKADPDNMVDGVDAVDGPTGVKKEEKAIKSEPATTTKVDERVAPVPTSSIAGKKAKKNKWGNDDDVTSSDEDNDEGIVDEFLVKWRVLGYIEASWELRSSIQEEEQIARFRRFDQPVSSEEKAIVAAHVKSQNTKRRATAQFKPIDNDANRLPNWGREGMNLRSYQLEGINWMAYNWHQGRSCILADEMGLGKTVQSMAFLHYLYNTQKIRGPFLVVAPLSTVAHWVREGDSWSNLNVLLYHGDASSRQVIRDYEWQRWHGKAGKEKNIYKFNVLVSTYEVVIQDAPLLSKLPWRALVVDEAHRIKNADSRLSKELVKFSFDHCLLLTGTPIQNNTMELFTLLHFLDPDRFKEADFQRNYATLEDSAQVAKLHAELKPYLLRRMKNDVEKSLPPREETVIEVELTTLQKQFYRAIYDRNTGYLTAKSTQKVSLMNIAMQLRKCCNHPFLLEGVEDQSIAGLDTRKEVMEKLIQASGKLVLLDKLLVKLKSGGHKVLIFSQMVRVLDILEDYLKYRNFNSERIDGHIRGIDRQSAIDRFSAKDSQGFVFLLCTRAGGVGINLTAADTVIIFDSDWNPQNDIQAQARCHRIGQTKSVQVYRLITRNTYEEKMFQKASMKLGLDRAVLQTMTKQVKEGKGDKASKDGDADFKMESLNKKEVEALLKHGAYHVFLDDDSKSKEFCEADIDSILARRAKVVKFETAGGDDPISSFSKASFVSSSTSGQAVDMDDPDFWKKIGLQEQAEREVALVRRDRKKVKVIKEDKEAAADSDADKDGSDKDSAYEKDEDSDKEGSDVEDGEGVWSKKAREAFGRAMVKWGFGRWDKIAGEPELPTKDPRELHRYGCGLLRQLVFQAAIASITRGDEETEEERKKKKNSKKKGSDDEQSFDSADEVERRRAKKKKPAKAAKKKKKKGSDDEDDDEDEDDAPVEKGPGSKKPVGIFQGTGMFNTWLTGLPLLRMARKDLIATFPTHAPIMPVIPPPVNVNKRKRPTGSTKDGGATPAGAGGDTPMATEMDGVSASPSPSPTPEMMSAPPAAAAATSSLSSAETKDSKEAAVSAEPPKVLTQAEVSKWPDDQILFHVPLHPSLTSQIWLQRTRRTARAVLQSLDRLSLLQTIIRPAAPEDSLPLPRKKSVATIASALGDDDVRPPLPVDWKDHLMPDRTSGGVAIFNFQPTTMDKSKNSLPASWPGWGYNEDKWLLLGMYVLGEKNYDMMRLDVSLGFHKIAHLPPQDEKVKVRTGRRGPKSRADREAEAEAAAALAKAKADPTKTAGPDGIVRQWPTLVALNKRARGILTVLSRRWKKQAINEAKSKARAALSSAKPLKTGPKPKFKEGAWSKVEKTKFYRAVRVFGLPAHLAPAGIPGFPEPAKETDLFFPWDQFSLHAELKRSPTALDEAATSFVKRCAWLAASTAEDQEQDTSLQMGTEMWEDSLSVIQARQARNMLAKFVRLRKILALEDLHDRLALIPKDLALAGQPPLPSWWQVPMKDIGLLRGINKWGTQYSQMASDETLDVFKNIPQRQPKPSATAATPSATSAASSPASLRSTIVTMEHKSDDGLQTQEPVLPIASLSSVPPAAVLAPAAPSSSTTITEVIPTGTDGGITSESSAPPAAAAATLPTSVTSAPVSSSSSSSSDPLPTPVPSSSIAAAITAAGATAPTISIPTPLSVPTSMLSGDGVQMSPITPAPSSTLVIDNDHAIDLTGNDGTTTPTATAGASSSSSAKKAGPIIPSMKVLDARFEFLLDFLEDPTELHRLISRAEGKNKSKKIGDKESKTSGGKKKISSRTPTSASAAAAAAFGRSGTPGAGDASGDEFEGDDAHGGLDGSVIDDDDDFVTSNIPKSPSGSVAGDDELPSDARAAVEAVAASKKLAAKKKAPKKPESKSGAKEKKVPKARPKKADDKNVVFDVQRDDNGDVKFPIIVSDNFQVDALGVVDSLRTSFHTRAAIFPIGYQSTRTHTSYKNPKVTTQYTCAITDDPDQGAPRFEVTASDDPDGTIVSDKANDAWGQVFTKISAAQNKNKEQNTSKGPELFGYGLLGIRELIEMLPGAAECRGYYTVEKGRQQAAVKAAKKLKSEAAAAAGHGRGGDDDEDAGPKRTSKPSKKKAAAAAKSSPLSIASGDDFDDVIVPPPKPRRVSSAPKERKKMKKKGEHPLDGDDDAAMIADYQNGEFGMLDEDDDFQQPVAVPMQTKRSAAAAKAKNAKKQQASTPRAASSRQNMSGGEDGPPTPKAKGGKKQRESAVRDSDGNGNGNGPAAGSRRKQKLALTPAGSSSSHDPYAHHSDAAAYAQQYYLQQQAQQAQQAQAAMLAAQQAAMYPGMGGYAPPHPSQYQQLSDPSYIAFPPSPMPGYGSPQDAQLAYAQQVAAAAAASQQYGGSGSSTQSPPTASDTDDDDGRARKHARTHSPVRTSSVSPPGTGTAPPTMTSVPMAGGYAHPQAYLHAYGQPATTGTDYYAMAAAQAAAAQAATTSPSAAASKIRGPTPDEQARAIAAAAMAAHPLAGVARYPPT